ncbi:MAG: VRR-NUC domain-containing protein [bacterium]
MVEDLPTGYYLENFNFLLDFVEQHYSDLLTQAEKAYRQDFRQLSLDAQRLYVRLTGRRGPLFRLDKLAYDEIGCLSSATAELLDKKLFQVPGDTIAADLLPLLTKKELLDRFARSDKRLKRQDLHDAIADQYSIEQIREHLGLDVIEPLGKEYLQVFKLLFFGNLHQDFTEFVLRDLGVSPFENYVMDASARYFGNRELLDGVLQSYLVADECRAVMEGGDANQLTEFAKICLDAGEIRETLLHRRYSKMYNTMARQLERYDRIEEAIRLYEKSIVAPARERRSRIYDSLGRTNEAIDLCQQIHEDPVDEAEAEFSVKFATRVSKRHRLEYDWIPTTSSDDFDIDAVMVKQQPEVQVELQACDWYKSQGIDARYVENGLLPGLFGLYFWKVIFAPVRGAFFNPFQRGPVDLFTPEFKSERQAMIESRLDKMSDNTVFTDTVLETFDTKFGIANYFVNWRWLDRELIEKSLSRIPHGDLRLIFTRLLRDLRHNRSGFPDLIVFPASQGYRLTEIKGPGDKLQNNQKRWFRFFKASGIPANILNVAWR